MYFAPVNYVEILVTDRPRLSLSVHDIVVPVIVIETDHFLALLLDVGCVDLFLIECACSAAS